MSVAASVTDDERADLAAKAQAAKESVPLWFGASDIWYGVGKPAAEYIADLDPDTILGLLEERELWRERFQQEKQAYRSLLTERAEARARIEAARNKCGLGSTGDYWLGRALELVEGESARLPH